MQIDMSQLLLALGVLGVLGLLFGAGLAVAAKKFAVQADPLYNAVLAALPGANCGACGYPGCAGYASAVARGMTTIDKCPVGGNDLLKNLGELMGVATEPAADRLVALPYCGGGLAEAPTRFEYEGIQDCVAVTALSGGDKGCRFACVGYGTCVALCQFGAITMNANRLPVVDTDKCTACGLCVTGCPKQVLALRPVGKKVHIVCGSHDKGAVVRKLCQVGCIACAQCVKACPEKAIAMNNFLAQIDYDKCTNCGVCVEKCPTKTIQSPL